MLILLGLACSDYSLQGKDYPNGQGDIDPSQITPTEHPTIIVQPSPIEFGNVMKDCVSQPIEVTVTNRGYETLEVEDIDFVDDVSESFSHNASSFTLEFDDSYSFEVVFTPLLYRDFEVGLQVQSNDPTQSKVTVPTTGTGVSGALYEQSTIQEGYNKVDVLWVIDNSCSMSESISKVDENFEVFLDQFQGLQVDYQMAVITTDMTDSNESGRIQGDIITQNTPQSAALNTFLQTVGFGGSGDEKGLEATKSALTAPLINTENQGFLRQEASLSVIVISDENDDSSITTSSFVSWFRSLKSDPNMLRFNGFVGLSLGSNSLGCSITSVGEKYIEAAYQTQGFAIDLCISNYDMALQELSAAAAGLRIQFPLDKEPSSLASIIVEVDGVPVSQGLDGWTYDINTNSIVFHGESIPQPDSNVFFQYEPPISCE